jgi:diguanylate cyclase (GGDEF)-like protein
MKTSECNGDFQPAVWQARDGRLWVPTVKGLAVVQPRSLASALFAPPVRLERLLADGDGVALQDGLRLAPGVRRLVFEYAALTFQDPQRVRVRYRLEGFDESWVVAGERREASYTNLPAGRYRFLVQTVGEATPFGATLAQLHFSLRPRVYQTAWFYALLGLMVTCAGVGLHLLRVRHLEQREETLARLVAERTAELRQANLELHRLAVLDGLTDIANHRRFKQVLEQEWRRARRHSEALSLLIVDVDCFKSFNDSYGHQAGDACLRRVATALRETVRRPFDFVARYGGEEFAVLLPDTPAASALAVAERIRGDVEALAIPHASSSVAPVVTLSGGIATRVPSAALAAEELLHLADTALYAAKRAGRNRVVSAPD